MQNLKNFLNTFWRYISDCYPIDYLSITYSYGRWSYDVRKEHNSKAVGFKANNFANHTQMVDSLQTSVDKIEEVFNREKPTA